MASSSRNPAIAWSQKSEMPSTSRATLIVPSSSAPIAAPTALPLPPKIATPPTTTEAITISEKLVPPALVLIVWYWAAHSTPPTPAMPAAQREGGEHPPGHGNAGQPGAIRIRPDRVELPAGPERPQVVRPDPDHGGHRDREPRNPEDGRVGDVDESGGQRRSDDLVAADDQDVDALDDVEGGQRDHEAGHPPERHHQPVSRAERQPDARARPGTRRGSGYRARARTSRPTGTRTAPALTGPRGPRSL